jgi:hypothetical protein
MTFGQEPVGLMSLSQQVMVETFKPVMGQSMEGMGDKLGEVM